MTQLVLLQIIVLDLLTPNIHCMLHGRFVAAHIDVFSDVVVITRNIVAVFTQCMVENASRCCIFSVLRYSIVPGLKENEKFATSTSGQSSGTMTLTTLSMAAAPVLILHLL